MGTPEMLVLRAIHVLCGVYWAGGTLAATLFFMPTARAMGPEGGKYIQRIMGGKYPKVMSAAAGLVLLTGYRLIWIVSGGFSVEWAQTGYGMAMLSGMTDATIAFVVGIIMVKRKGERLAAIGGQIAASGKPPTPEQVAEMAGLQKAQALGMKIVAILLTLTVLAMAVARNL